MNSEKAKGIIFLSGYIFSLLVLLYAIPLILLSPTVSDDPYYIKNFRTNIEDFNNMKNRILELSSEHIENKITIWINYSDQMYFSIGDNKIGLTKEEKEWIKKMNDAFKTEVFNRIVYEDNRIIFGMEGNHYTIVYSVDGTAPKYMTDPSETRKWVRKNLKNNWYYFRSK